MNPVLVRRLEEILTGMWERGITPTRLRVLAAATDAGLGDQEAEEIANAAQALVTEV
ncbi:hypothetical protein [Microvirga aerophila]|uniref:Uncharacterized protein n=1 Tax=Microvirga aerophila TaxID=670291 RepID=A0A512C226_9HYPH|nr:hypothetical protein [Microvirga aerophila]GEO18077.1 hypothetical protein MAE02_57730 [Microvirga aerophila]